MQEKPLSIIAGIVILLLMLVAIFADVLAPCVITLRRWAGRSGQLLPRRVDAPSAATRNALVAPCRPAPRSLTSLTAYRELPGIAERQERQIVGTCR